MSEVEDVIIEEVVSSVNLTPGWVAGGLVIGLAIGGAAGYFYAEKKLRMKYQQISDDEIDSMREHYRSKEIAREVKPEVEEIVKEQGYVAAPIPPKEEVTGSDLTRARSVADVAPEKPEDIEAKKEILKRENIFAKAETEDEWDYEEEVRMRRPDYPYVIHVDELGELSELDSLSWTYWEGDEILVNASNDVVTDVERSVGLANLDKFGHGSGDINTVYIRNVVLGIEIEIIRSEGKYEEEVLGLKHFDENARRRTRHFDDGTG